MLRLTGTDKRMDFERQLREFRKRVREQGQEHEAMQAYERMRKADYNKRKKDGQSDRHAGTFSKRVALTRCLDMFPEDEQLKKLQQANKLAEAEKKELAKANARLKVKHGVSPEQVEQKRERNRYVAEQLKGKKKTDIITDIEFARDNCHMIVDPEDHKTWLIEPKEAPSASAWNMLMYAIGDPKSFYTMAIKETRGHNSGASKGGRRRASSNAHDRVQEMLREMSDTENGSS